VKLAFALLLTGCWSGAPPAEPAPAKPPPERGRPRIVVSEAGVGPIDAQFVVSPAAVRKAFPGYRLELEQHDEYTVLFNIHDPDEMVFYIVPYHDCRPFGIHIVSDQVDVVSHGWRVGRQLGSYLPIDTCECWGDDTRTCYRKGEHVAAVFEGECLDSNKDDFTTLAGATITRVVWQPEAWGGDWTMGSERFDCVHGERIHKHSAPPPSPPSPNP